MTVLSLSEGALKAVYLDVFISKFRYIPVNRTHDSYPSAPVTEVKRRPETVADLKEERWRR